MLVSCSYQLFSPEAGFSYNWDLLLTKIFRPHCKSSFHGCLTRWKLPVTADWVEQTIQTCPMYCMDFRSLTQTPGWGHLLGCPSNCALHSSYSAFLPHSSCTGTEQQLQNSSDATKLRKGLFVHGYNGSCSTSRSSCYTVGPHDNRASCKSSEDDRGHPEEWCSLQAFCHVQASPLK